MLEGSLGGFGFWATSVGLTAAVESLLGAAEGLRAEEGAVDSVCLTPAVDALRGASEGFRSVLASGALVRGMDALRGAVDGAGDSADLVAGVEALLGAREGLRSGAASLGAGVDFLGGA